MSFKDVDKQVEKQASSLWSTIKSNKAMVVIGGIFVAIVIVVLAAQVFG